MFVMFCTINNAKGYKDIFVGNRSSWSFLLQSFNNFEIILRSLIDCKMKSNVNLPGRERFLCFINVIQTCMVSSTVLIVTIYENVSSTNLKCFDKCKDVLHNFSKKNQVSFCGTLWQKMWTACFGEFWLRGKWFNPSLSHQDLVSY